MSDKDTPDLEAFFEAARAHPPEPSADFLARIQADALAEQPVRAAALRKPLGLGAQILAVLGGWPAVAGLATAAVTGLWIGVAPPDAVSQTVSELLYGSDVLSVDPLSGFETLLLEG